jgi:hypothetical protein
MIRKQREHTFRNTPVFCDIQYNCFYLLILFACILQVINEIPFERPLLTRLSNVIASLLETSRSSSTASFTKPPRYAIPQSNSVFPSKAGMFDIHFDYPLLSFHLQYIGHPCPVSCRLNSPISANPPDNLVLGTNNGLGSAGPSTVLSVELVASYTTPSSLALLSTPLHPSPFSTSTSSVHCVLELVIILPVRSGGCDVRTSTKLSCLLRGHASVLRMRAGAAVTTRDVRNGRLANTMLSVDSAVYHGR